MNQLENESISGGIKNTGNHSLTCHDLQGKK